MRKKRALRLLLHTLLLSGIVVLLAELLVFVSGTMVRSPLQGLENEILDLAFQVRDTNYYHDVVSPDRIVIIDIDDASIARLGRTQQWPRSFDAKVISYISEGDPAGIGIDYLYTEPDTFSHVYVDMLRARGFENAQSIIASLRSDDELARAIANSGNVYLGLFDDTSMEEFEIDPVIPRQLRLFKGDTTDRLLYRWLSYPVLPVADFVTSARATGPIAMPTMTDGTVRRYQVMQELAVHYDQPLYAANFPFYMMLDTWNVADSSVKISRHGITFRQGERIRNIKLSEDGSFRINWMGSEEKFRYIPFYKVLEQRIPPEFFKDKYVFLGTSASGLQDLKTVPSRIEKMPGVEVHAIAFLNMMNGAFISEYDEVAALPWFACIALVLVMFFLGVRPIAGFLLALGVAFGEMYLFVQWILPVKGIVFPVVTLMLMTFCAYITASLYTYFTRERKNRRLRNAFGSYVSPDIVNQIVKDASRVQLGGEKKELTVLFSDIRGFTAYSEKLDPQQIVAMLNDYLSRMSEIIFRHRGTIDKFIGDAIMAIFGAPVQQPDHASRACMVALAMVENLAKFNSDRASEGWEPLEIGIGINTGDMTVGNIGSSKRFDYTVIGDSVNLGSRLEGLTKFFGVNVIVSESTYKAVDESLFLFRELALVQVKGKEQPVTVYQLVDDAGAKDQYRLWLQKWSEALRLFRENDQEAAISAFEECFRLFPNDVASKRYIRQCEIFLADPSSFSIVMRMNKK